MGTDQQPQLPNASTAQWKHDKPGQNSGSSNCCCAVADDFRMEWPQAACRPSAQPTVNPEQSGGSLQSHRFRGRRTSGSSVWAAAATFLLTNGNRLWQSLGVICISRGMPDGRGLRSGLRPRAVEDVAP